MHGLRGTYLLTYLVTAAAVITMSLAFNIDVTQPKVHTGEKNDFFGYKVLQYRSGDKKGIIVTAPLRLNGSGGICDLDSDKWFQPAEHPLPNPAVTKHLGLSIAVESTGSQSTFQVCSPSVAHECQGNSYLNSICYKITHELKPISSFTPAFQNCTKKTVNLVFLFDGSGSMTEAEFHKNKEFIVDIMESLKNSSIKFAAVQFSSEYRKVFDFNDYEDGTAHEKLMRERHMKDLTNTHKALNYVLNEIFDSPDAGASPDATKVLVLITDGNPSDRDRNNITKRYDEKNIIRFVIAVKNVDLNRFENISSEPNNTFKIENYNGLTGVLENFQKKIFKVEGEVATLAGNLTNEMAQSGFSAVYNKDTLILGSVGSNTWRGSLQEHQGNKETQIEDPVMEMDSYMGYSVSVGQKNNVPLYFTGAPRFQHTGQVLLFKHNTTWTIAQRIKDDQIGSYFGAELCSVDINEDNNTDFLLVGAPQFYQPHQKKEGRIYIYTLTDEVQLDSVLNVTAPSTGRFGTSISSIKDLNGDGLRDVAVGAPFEDDNRGAVYIYLGDRHSGIRTTFSQRIKGEMVQSGIRFFGQAIDGNMDLKDDKLPDIVVGSQGAAVILSSKPVVNVVARLSFKPAVISTEKLYCPDNTNEKLHMVTMKTCFEMNEATNSETGEGIGLNITYTLTVDPMRQTNRGFFNQTDKRPRNLTSTYELQEPETCFEYPIFMPKCVKDTLSPVTIKLLFSQPDSNTSTAILNVDNKNQSFIEVPFEKQCRKNDTCIAEFEVDFNFTVPKLVVIENEYFNVTAKLVNHGDDSYNTNLTMYYPPGISFSRMTLIESTRPTLHDCRDQQAIDKTICGVSHPVYRRGSSATFNISFYVTKNDEWNDTISMTIAGKSDNSVSNKTFAATKTIPVQYEIKMALTVSEESTTYLNFTSEEEEKNELITITYRIDNTGSKDFPVNVSLFFMNTLEYDFEMKNTRVSVRKSKTQCKLKKHLKSEHCSSEGCRAMECDGFILDKHEGVEFTLSVNVKLRNLKERAKNIPFLKRYSGETSKVTFLSKMMVKYDEQRYILGSHKHEEKGGDTLEHNPTMKTNEVRVEIIILPNKLQIILTGIGLGILLLIILTIIMYKMGCFKRKTMQDYQEQEDAALQASTAIPVVPAFESTKGNLDSKSDQASENDKLLDSPNGSTTPAATPEQMAPLNVSGTS